MRFPQQVRCQGALGRTKEGRNAFPSKGPLGSDGERPGSIQRVLCLAAVFFAVGTGEGDISDGVGEGPGGWVLSLDFGSGWWPDFRLCLGAPMRLWGG